MELFKLDPTSYLPVGKKIEGYSELIFTERHDDHGDFVLTTPAIGEMATYLPEDTLISHLETDDIHIVEDHVTEIDDFGRPVLKITGRSATRVFEDRHVDAKYGKKRKMRQKYTPRAAASVLIWQAVNNGSGKDVTHPADKTWNDKDVIPNCVVVDSTAATGQVRNQWLELGALDPQLQKLLEKGDVGLRIRRPVLDARQLQVISVVTGEANRGNINAAMAETKAKLVFEMYQGTNRASTVKFRTLHGDLEKVQYLMSKQNYKTVIEVLAPIGIGDQYRSGETNATGFGRRVGWLDAGDPDIPDEPQRPKDPRDNASAQEKEDYRKALNKWRDDHAAWDVEVNGPNGIKAEFRADALEDAATALKDSRRVSMVSGEISPLAPYQFKKDYNLGDRVTLEGDYNQTTEMIVTEYIRTENAEGDHGIPGLKEP